MEDIYRQIRSILKEGKRGVLASVVSRKGSAPMSADAKMLVLEDGSISGTIGGGCMEGEVWAEAKMTLRRGTATKMSFKLTEKEAGESGHICGGLVDVLVEPLSNFDMKLLSEIIHIRDKDGLGVLASVINRTDKRPPGPEEKILVRRDGSTLGSIKGVETEIGHEATEVLQTGNPATSTFRLPESNLEVEVFLEPIMARIRVYIFGGGHISQHIAKVASVTDLQLVIVEDRSQFANPKRFPDVENLIVLMDFEDLENAMPEIRPTDMAVLVTRGHQHDEDVLAWAWDKPFRYLGMIGSRTKILITYRRLEKRTGVPRNEFIKRIRAPVGLEIGSETPGEIAVAIVAELIQVRRQSRIRDSQLAGSPKSKALLKFAKDNPQVLIEEVYGSST